MTAAQWTAPVPLWTESAIRRSGPAFRQPALLRFESDRFMDELAGVLGSRPDTLAALVARPETWKTPRVGLAAPPAERRRGGCADRVRRPLDHGPRERRRPT